MTEKQSTKAVLIILDGWGLAPEGKGNAIRLANTPVFNRLVKLYPTFTLRAAGDEVGLSWGEMGNSEVGHLTIGAGRVFYQALPRINKAIADGSFEKNEAFNSAFESVKKNDSTLHLAGMVSSGGVHSHQDHLYKLLELAKKHKIKKVAIHAFLDGRDAQFNSGAGFIKELEKRCKKIGVGEIASISGRYFAMDRDNRWDRTQKVFMAMVHGKGETAQNIDSAIEDSYKRQVYDEEFIPTVITDNKGKPRAIVQKNDAVIFWNFREDRMRQITKALALPTFEKFERNADCSKVSIVTMTEYEKSLPVIVAFATAPIAMCLSKSISDAKLTQLHIAETEKYAHVTFFLNGLTEQAYPGEERILIPSPKVPTYDKKPEMSAHGVSDKTVKEIMKGAFDCLIVNFANADMVGHTGDIKATIKAVETIDKELGTIVTAALAKDVAVMITADHGNAEEMLNLQTNMKDKEHSTNSVPCIIIKKDLEGKINNQIEAVHGDLALIPPEGALTDVAPTFLKLLEVKKPKEMTGSSLI